MGKAQERAEEGESGNMKWTEDEYMAYQQQKGYLPPPTKKPPKYHNVKTIVDGVYFDSQKEAEFYNDLKMLLQAGHIKGFCRQAEFILQEGFAGTKPICYIADFIIFNNDGTATVKDVKGGEITKTPEFKIKQKLFKKKFNMEINTL